MPAFATKNAGTIHQVSPTVLSSDLFTPLREPRITLPTIGVHVRETPLQPWGGCLTTYGGTGGLSFLGSYKVRDLHLGRSHRHFGSGLSYHPTTTQPYRLTALKLSDCRTNDQRLTTSLKADGVSSIWQREAWPGHHPYFSHRSIFDVFPTGVSLDGKDPKERYDGVVSETTRIALRKVQENLYQQTLYREYFGKEIANSTTTTAIRKPGVAKLQPSNRNTGTDKVASLVKSKTDSDETVYRDKQKIRIRDRNDESECDESDAEPDGEEEESGCNEFDNTSRCDDEVEQYKSKIKDSVKELLDKLSQQRKERERLGYPPLPQAPLEQQHTSGCVPPPPPLPPRKPLPPCLLPSSRTRHSKPDCDTANNVLDEKLPEKKSHTDRKLTFASGSPVAGVGPCWPPSTSHVIDNIRGSQLLERGELSEFPEAYLSTLEPRTTIAEGTCVPDTAKQLDATTPTLTIKPQIYPHYTPNFPLKESSTHSSPHFFVEFHPTVSVFHQPNKSTEPALILRRPNADIIYLPPVPLSDCLTPSGSNIPHKLGLRFKTEAHRRFHAMHQEEVPDLRSTKNWGKKYFFFDYHSSALRG